MIVDHLLHSKVKPFSLFLVLSYLIPYMSRRLLSLGRSLSLLPQLARWISEANPLSLRSVWRPL